MTNRKKNRFYGNRGEKKFTTIVNGNQRAGSGGLSPHARSILHAQGNTAHPTKNTGIGFLINHTTLTITGIGIMMKNLTGYGIILIGDTIEPIDVIAFLTGGATTFVTHSGGTT